MKKLKRYKPIKVFSIYFGYGWWLGKRVYFVGKHSTAFAILPLAYICKDIEYASNGRIVGSGDTASWSKARQNENDEIRCYRETITFTKEV
ncbi:MAG: hypothetical protein IJ550_02225 [Bacteroidaceae bacterium]|nr:hypothetical protein [Bacteroidaceae bacterium]